MAVPSSAHADSVPLYSFNGSDGAYPRASLIQGSDGNFYGTTEGGGAYNLGTVFKITPGGSLATLHSFNGSNGAYPDAGLAIGYDDNFYGVTRQGGSSAGLGTVFKITPSGGFTVLHSFNRNDGASPNGILVKGNDGNFYGTTFGGGPRDVGAGGGTIFRMSPAGAFTTIYSFNGLDGNDLYAGLVLGTDGQFYGTTFGGGTTGQGTIFKITSTGTLTTLHNFVDEGVDGAYPYGGLVQASNGDLYGTTFWGGTVFKITLSGELTVVHKGGNLDDGGQAVSALIQATDGNLYGTMSGYGPPGSAGEVFKIDANDTFSVFYGFNGIDAGVPWGAVLQGRDRNLYGTTAGGGVYGLGTVYKLTLSIGLPTSIEDCKDGGWSRFNVPRLFTNQGDCIQFVNTAR